MHVKKILFLVISSSIPALLKSMEPHYSINYDDYNQEYAQLHLDQSYSRDLENFQAVSHDDNINSWYDPRLQDYPWYNSVSQILNTVDDTYDMQDQCINTAEYHSYQTPLNTASIDNDNTEEKELNLKKRKRAESLESSDSEFEPGIDSQKLTNKWFVCQYLKQKANIKSIKGKKIFLFKCICNPDKRLSLYSKAKLTAHLKSRHHRKFISDIKKFNSTEIVESYCANRNNIFIQKKSMKN